MGDVGIPFQCNKATRKLIKALQERPCGSDPLLCGQFPAALPHRCRERAARAAGASARAAGQATSTRFSTVNFSPERQARSYH